MLTVRKITREELLNSSECQKQDEFDLIITEKFGTSHQGPTYLLIPQQSTLNYMKMTKHLVTIISPTLTPMTIMMSTSAWSFSFPEMGDFPRLAKS